MTQAMQGKGAYDRNSDYQKRASLAYESLLEGAGHGLTDVAYGDHVTIVDYG